MNLQIKRLPHCYQLPSRATDGSAALDIYATEPGVVDPGGIARIPTGIAVAFPQGAALLISGRSGNGARYGAGVPQGYGLIDSDYRGEIFVVLTSLHNFIWARGDRIAQMLMVPIIVPELELVEELPATVRGTGGFGSTGAN